MTIKSLITKIKNKLFKNKYIKDKSFPAFWFDKVLKKSTVFVVQIGSNDGKKGDPIHPLLKKNKQWKALFVEPVPYLFDALKKNYPDPSRFTFENAAISKEEGELTFYWVDPKAKNYLPNLPFWYDQLGSFDKQHIVKHLNGVLEPYILSSKVTCFDLPTLLSKNKVEHISILHIDTEGHDWNILSQLNLDKFQPEFILFEHNHLSEMDLKASYLFLKSRYHLFKVGIDILAVNKSINSSTINHMKQYMQGFQS